MSYRAGDAVLHRPTGEEWALAADEYDGRVVCCGWPETVAMATDCEIVKAASDDERLKMLADVARSCTGQMRGGLAAWQLDAARRAGEGK